MANETVCTKCGANDEAVEMVCENCHDQVVDGIKGEVCYDGTDYEKLTHLLLEIGVSHETADWLSAKTITIGDAVEINFHKDGAYANCGKVDD